MRYTFLEIVQLLLSSMDGDEVDSWSDTTESTQVGHIVKNVFYDIATELDLPEHETLFELDASGDNAKPTLMTLPSDVVKLSWVKYDNKATADTYKDFRNVAFLDFQTFLTRQTALREETSNVGEMVITANGQSHEIMYRSNEMPKVYTIFDDNQIIFNSYDSTEDTTLQQEKTMCHGTVYPTFSMTDASYPDIDPSQFAYFIQKCKVRAHAELRQLPHREALQESFRQKVRLQRAKRRSPNYSELDQLPNFGRK
jgi:hypothetical protein